MKISFRFRSLISFVALIFTIAGVILSFFTLPIVAAVPIAIFGAIISWITGKIVYNYPVYFLHGGADIAFEENSRIAFIWGKQEFKGKMIPEMGILYETKKVASHVYKNLRFWNSNSFIDKSQNIVVSIVYEGDKKYSVFLYPGQRTDKKQEIVDSVTSILKQNSEVELRGEIKPFLHNSADYDKRPEMQSFIESLKEEEFLFLNTYYVKSDVPIAYAKRSIRLENIVFNDRADLKPSMIEYHNKWVDPNISIPETVKRVDKIKLN